jgi:hypothetical protein
MKKQKLTREQWIQKAYEHLVKRLVEPERTPSPVEKKNLSDWAEVIAESYFDVEDERIEDPIEAVEEDLSYA